MTRRTTVLFTLLAALLAGLAVWNCRFMTEKRRARSVALADLQRCRQIVWKIAALRRRPSMACDEERLSAETIGLTEQAAKSAGIRTDKLTRITPAPPRRLGDTVYKEKPTQVLLKNVTLEQLVGMLYSLAGGEKGLHPKSLRLTAPRADDCGETWNAELVLTYLIYDPPSSKR